MADAANAAMAECEVVRADVTDVGTTTTAGVVEDVAMTVAWDEVAPALELLVVEEVNAAGNVKSAFFRQMESAPHESPMLQQT